MSEQSDKFLEIFRTACREIPDKQILVEWMVYALGALSARTRDEELDLIEDEIWNRKQMVRH